MPGPFQFLAEAGQTLGAIGEEKQRREERARAIAEKGTSMLLNQILQGGDPAILDDPGVQKMMKTAYGFSVPSKYFSAIGATPRYEAEVTEAERRAGVPAAKAGAEAATAGVTTQRAGITAGELGRVQPGTAAARAVAEVPSEPVASSAEEAATTGARLKATQARFQQNITEGAVRLFGEDKDIRRIAEMAAIPGVLDYTLARIQEQWHMMSQDRQNRATNTQFLMGAMREGTIVYKQRVDDWATSRDKVMAAKQRELLQSITQYQTMHSDEETAAFKLKAEAELEAYMQNWETGNPEPQFETEFKNFLHTTYNMTPEQYSDFIHGGLEMGDPATARRQREAGTSGAGTGAGTPPPDPKQRIGGAIRASVVGDPTINGRFFGRNVKNKKFTDLEAHQVLTHLQRLMQPDVFAKFEAAYEEAIK
jgi:hypothetical protein